MNLDDIEQLMQLITKYAVEQVIVDGITITKTQHISPEEPKNDKTIDEDDDDLLFHST